MPEARLDGSVRGRSAMSSKWRVAMQRAKRSKSGAVSFDLCWQSRRRAASSLPIMTLLCGRVSGGQAQTRRSPLFYRRFGRPGQKRGEIEPEHLSSNGAARRYSTANPASGAAMDGGNRKKPQRQIDLWLLTPNLQNEPNFDNASLKDHQNPPPNAALKRAKFSRFVSFHWHSDTSYVRA